MGATSSDVELKRLLAELRRRPHLLRDPHVARLVSAAVARLQAQKAAPPAETSVPPAKQNMSRRDRSGQIHARYLVHCVGDLLAVGGLLAAPAFLPERLLFGIPSSSAWILVVVLLFVRAEAVRVAAVEALGFLWRLLYGAVLWYGEALLSSAHRAWLRFRRVQDIIAAWRRRPAMERHSFAALLAFLESEVKLDLIQMSALGSPPDWSRIEGRLGTWGNPALRWRGDKRLLPSSLYWIVSRAIMMAETQAQAQTTPRVMPGMAAVAEREEPRSAIAEDVAHVQSKIKSLEEEIRKIQSWNVKQDTEEASRRQLISEKRAELNELHHLLKSILSRS